MNPQTEQDKGLDQQKEPIVPPSPPKSRLPLLLTFIFLVVLILVGGYKLMSNSSTPPPQPTPQVQPSPTPDPTTNSKTYINQGLGFSFNYPQEFEYMYDYIETDGGQLLLQNYDGMYPEKTSDSVKFQLHLTVGKLKTNTLEEHVWNQTKILEKDYNIDLLDPKKIEINGTQGFEGEGIVKGDKVIRVWLENNGFDYTLIFTPSTYSNRELFTQILSTFTFLNN